MESSLDLPFARLVAALLKGAEGDAVLVAWQPPLAVVERPHDGAGIVVLDGARASELRAGLDRVLAAHQAGLLFVVVAGGGPEARETLAAADREAPNPNKLGVYHLDAAGKLAHVAGRKLRPLEQAAAAVASVPPFSPDEAPAIIARGQGEREEAMRFAATLGARRPRVTLALAAACVVLHVLAWQWGRESFGEALLRMGANSGPLVAHGEIWRLLASAFLHGGIVHLLVNMLALQSFGGFLEAVIGPRRYLLLWGASALGGSLASAVIAGNPLSVGASGALWGLMTAGFALARRRQSVLPARVASGLRRQLISVLLLNAFISFLPGIDFSAHLGGGVVGFLLAGPLASTAAEGRDPRWLRLAATAMAIALAASIVIALAVGRPWQLGSATL